MSAKKNGTAATAAQEEGSVQEQQGPIIFDETLVSKKGWTLRIILDISRMEQDAERYQDQLMFSRGIPFDLEHVTAIDHLAVYVANKQHWLDGNGVIEATRAHYRKLTTEAYREAVMLAITAHPDNVFDQPAKPWPVEEEQELPGIIVMPKAEKKLENPVEFRLKQIYDRLESDVLVIAGFEQAFTRATVELTRRLSQQRQDTF